MSVLNKMLRDLEQREQRHNAETPGPLMRGISNEGGRPLWLNVLLILTVGLLAFAIYAILQRHVVPITAIAEPAAAVSASTASDNGKAPDAPSQEAQSKHVPIPDQQRQTAQHSAPQAADSGPPAEDSAPASAATQPAVQAIATALAVPQAGAADVTDRPADRSDAAPPVATASTTQQHGSARPVKVAAVPVLVQRGELSVTQRANRLTEQAMAAEQAGDIAQALQLWQQLQAVMPEQAKAYLAQARLWQLSGHSEQAQQVLQQALAQQIVDADIQLMLAQYAAARQHWQQVDALLPGQFALAQHPDYYGLKATALQQLGQQQTALGWFSQLLVLQPQQPRWWLGAAIAHDALQNRAQAYLHYQQALQWGDGLSAASRDYIQQRLQVTE